MKRRMLKREISQEFLLPPSATVLIVDDDREDLDYHARILQGQGHTVLACPTFSAGIELARYGEFDFAFVAQGGPEFEGREILAALRERQPAIQFAVLARSMQPPCYLEAMELGAIDYLEKPVHPAELKGILSGRLEPAMAV